MPAAELFAGGGATGALCRGLDWSATPLGAVESWPQSLRALVRVVLSSRYPMLLLWGPQLTQIYNDAYSALIGDKHPAALGGDVRVTLAEGWDVLGPIVGDAMRTGAASWVPGLQLLLERAGYREEAYFTVSHAPAQDDDGATVGVLTVCSEVTDVVVGERRLQLLRDLSLQEGERFGVAATTTGLAGVLEGRPDDVPFAAVYLREGDELVLAGAAGRCTDGASVGDRLPARLGAGASYDDVWRLRAVADGAGAQGLDLPDGVQVTGGPWADPVTQAVTMPLAASDRDAPAVGVLLVGITPSRALDAGYRSFLDLVAQQVSVAVRNALAYDAERRRAAALAELDRAKTQFFTNVSHEFRTPLTLMLGPLSDALDDAAAPLPAAQRERIATARRNAGRLLTLVNELLDFSRLEAGEAAGDVQAIDLAAFTAELASAFRAAVERGGLELVVDCPPLPRPVALDPADWEKVVVNLLSNAFKFTFVGSIRVTLESDEHCLRLVVSDTGVGIAPEDLGRLFQRFQRVQGSRSRSHEGSGIGLALVREVVRMAGGDVSVQSEVGRGTTFTVELPWTAVAARGTETQPAPVTTGTRAEQALQWTGPSAAGRRPSAAAARRDERLPDARVLVADDNADMRDYVGRLLEEQGWEVEAVADGTQALEAARRRPPDLLLTDVMMPGLDGFELVRALRREPATAALPIVVLSARAGQDASVEGLELGADDYVVKPFQASELVARLRTTMLLARARGSHTRHLEALADTAAVLTSARALEEAVRVVTEQARVLLGGTRAETVMHAGEGREELRFASPDSAASSAPVEMAPLVGRRGRELGTLTVEGAPVDAQHAALLRPVAQMLAALAEGTWQLQRQSEVARTLQRSLLPDRLPELDGLELAAHYLPATGDVEVGGDWYDVLALPDGRVALSVGDVAGHGLAAAATMGQFRNAARAYVVEGLSPAEVVARLEALAVRLDITSPTTVFLGYLDPRSGALEWCNAGHLPPVVVTPGAGARWLEGPLTPPVGAALGVPAQPARAVLDAGAALLLYTDGLVEDRASQLEQGMPQLLQRTGASVLGTADELLRTALSSLPAERPDDVAVLAVRRLPVTADADGGLRDAAARFTYPATPAAAALARRDLRRVLTGAGADDDLVFDLLLAASEAVNNAVEHALDPSRPEIELLLAVEAGAVRLAVRDFGRWRERGASMDRGHGSTLMSAFGEVHVVPGEDGTTVTLERHLRGSGQEADGGEHAEQGQ